MMRNRLVLPALCVGFLLVGACSNDNPTQPPTQDGAVHDTTPTPDQGMGEQLPSDSIPPLEGLYASCLTDACSDGLVCLGGLCHKPCDPTKGVTGNADCPADPAHVCDGPMAPTPICRLTCDPTAGVANPTCPVGMVCTASDDYSPGFCEYTSAVTRQGPRKLGESCAPDYPAAKFCDGATGLFCYQGAGDASDPMMAMMGASMPAKCAKACDPREGAASNAACEATETCVEDASSFLQGRCQAAPSKQLGEHCNADDMQCVVGFSCVEGACATTCDPAKGTTDNADCGAQASDYWCYSTLRAAGCLKKCDPDNGEVVTAECDAGDFCRWDKEDFAPGFCKTLPAPEEGTVDLGGDCGKSDLELFCKAGLVCVDSTCVTACDPTASTPEAPCAEGEACVESTWVASGGYCVTPGTLIEGEICDNLTHRCGAGLVCQGVCTPICHSWKASEEDKQGDCPSDQFICLSAGDMYNNWVSFCAPFCDPTSGPPFANPDCPPGAYCLEGWMLGLDAPGLCLVAEHAVQGQQTQVGAPCDKTTAATRCNFYDNWLACDDYSDSGQPSNKCLQMCDLGQGMEANPKCGATEICMPSGGSFYGGMCLTGPSQAAGEPCNDTTMQCNDGLFCVKNRCHTLCDMEAGEENNPDCTEANTICKEWAPNFGMPGTPVCRKKCDAAKGVLPNPDCPAGSGCISETPGSLAAGLCEPTLPPPSGTQIADAPCDTADIFGQCDGASGLICTEMFTCQVGCDPMADVATNGCGDEQICISSWNSSLGGYCL